MGAPSFLLGGDVKSSWRRSEWSDWATGDVCIFLFGSWLSVFVYTGNYWTGNLSSRVQAQISEDQWRETGVSERPRACVAHTRKGFMSYSSWRKYKQPQERPGDLRGDTSGGGGGQEEDVTTLQWGKYHLLSIFFFNDNHYNRDHFQDWSDWNARKLVQMVGSPLRMKGLCCGVSGNVTDEINMPL